MGNVNFKQRLYIFTMIILVLMLLQGCVYDQMTHLSEEDMEWVTCVKKGDSYLFVSNLGNTDTLQITQIEIENSKQPFHGLNRRLFDFYEAFAKYKFEIRRQQKKLRDNIGGSLTIVRHIDDNCLGFSTDFDKRYSKYNYHIDIYNNHFQEFEKYFKQYDPDIQDYLIIDDNNSMYSIYDKDIDNKIIKYIINSKYGLIYYKYENGEEFVRKFL